MDLSEEEEEEEEEEEDVDSRQRDYYTDTTVRTKRVIYWQDFVSKRMRRHWTMYQ